MDPALEIVRAVIVGFVLVLLLRSRKKPSNVYTLGGWKYIVAGFCLIFFGTLIDITDNFESLNRYVFIGDTVQQAFLEKIVGYLFGYLMLAIGFRIWLPKIVEHEKYNQNKLAEAVEEIQSLTGLLPICSNCKKIRDDQGYWKQVEKYIQDHSDAKFTHSICPDCVK